jgi:hypothetical protein
MCKPIAMIEATISGEVAATALAVKLVKDSVWFEVMPECDDRWTITVKEEAASLLPISAPRRRIQRPWF